MKKYMSVDNRLHLLALFNCTLDGRKQEVSLSVCFVPEEVAVLLLREETAVLHVMVLEIPN